MFSRRHFRVIAEIIANLVISNDEHSEDELQDVEGIRQAIAMQFADQLGRHSASFNRVKFLAACRPAVSKVVLTTFTCPRCHKRTRAPVDCEGLKCGDCLMNDCEVVTMCRS